MTLFEFFMLMFFAIYAVGMVITLNKKLDVHIIYPEPKTEEHRISAEDQKFIDEQQGILDAAAAIQDLFGVNSEEDD